MFAPHRALAALLLLIPLAAAAQEAPPPLTEADGWRTRAVFTLAGSQAAFHNWQEGGTGSLAATTGLTGRFERVLNGFKQTHDTRLAFGVIRLDTTGVRKAVDDARYSFDVQYLDLGPIRPTFAAEIRSQFAPGFDYGRADRPKVSDAFSPAYLTQSLGATYEPAEWFRTRLGLGVRETVVLIERLRPNFGNRPDQPVRIEAGLSSMTELNREVWQNVLLKSRLSVFAAFAQFERPPDALFENQLKMKVNDYLNVSLEVVTLFDRNVSNRLQVRELLTLGVSVALL